MVGGASGYGGSAGPVWQFFLRHRVLLLSIVLFVLGIATGTATAIAVLQNASPQVAGLICAGAALAGGCAMIQTRHPGLAVLTATAPLPGLIWAAPLSVGAAFGAVPILAYIVGYAVAVALAHSILAQVLDGAAAGHPWRAAGAALGLMAVLGLLWFWQSSGGAAMLQATLDVGFVVASVLLLMPIGASFLHFDETFVAQANRAREWRQRVMEKIAMVAVPRWGMSLAGIALVFVALAWFGAEPLVASLEITHATALLGVSAALVLLIATMLCGGWREGFAAAIVVALVWLMSLWAFAVSGTMKPIASVGILELVALAVFLASTGAQHAQAYRRLGDDPAIARLRAVEDIGGSQIFATIGGLLALMPSIVVRPADAVYAVGALFAGIGSLAFAPAIVTASEAFVIRRRSVEELYGRR